MVRQSMEQVRIEIEFARKTKIANSELCMSFKFFKLLIQLVSSVCDLHREVDRGETNVRRLLDQTNFRLLRNRYARASEGDCPRC